jgi:hypothetical protein
LCADEALILYAEPDVASSVVGLLRFPPKASVREC